MRRLICRLAPLGLVIITSCIVEKTSQTEPLIFDRLTAWKLKLNRSSGEPELLTLDFRSQKTETFNSPAIVDATALLENNRINVSAKINNSKPILIGAAFPLAMDISIRQVGQYELYDKETNRKFATILINDTVITESKKMPPAWFNEDGSIIGYGQSLSSIEQPKFKY
jgi:hypothetical protein